MFVWYPPAVKELMAVLDNLEFGILITDKLGRTLFTNATFRKLEPQTKDFREQERDHILAALNRSGGKIYGPDGAAALLGLRPTTLVSRLRRYGLPPKRRRRVVAQPEPYEEPPMLD